MTTVPVKYVPKTLSKKDKEKQRQMLKKSRSLYKKGIYYTRKKINSFKSKVSPHILKARKIYKIENIKPSKELAKKTKCSIQGLKKIVKKGMGAYYSSGSRPSQTGHSWGYARLGSAITGGKASAVDYHVLKEHCKPEGTALKLANKSKKIYGKGTERTKQTQLGGMRTIKKLVKNPKKKSKSRSKSKTNKMILPQRKDGKLFFKDHPDFTPALSPKEIFELGSFGGTYWRPITSRVTGKPVKLKDQHKKYPKNWWENLSEDQLTSKWEDYDIGKNKYKVKVGTTLEFWEDKGWIREQNPYGWVQWYCDFYTGIRSNDDERQIARWKAMRRFLIPLARAIKKINGDFDNPTISPGRRQTLQHWGYDLTKKDYDKLVNDYNMK